MTWMLDDRPLHAVLVTRLRYLGDVAMATAVCGLLRRGDPGLRLGFCCEAPYAPVLAGQPDLDGVHALAVRRRGADARARTPAPAPEDEPTASVTVGDEAVAGAGSPAAAGTVATVRALRGARYDLAVDLFGNPRSAWLLWLAGVPARIGPPRGGRRRLYTHLAGPLPRSAPAAARQRLPGGLGDLAGRLAPLRHRETGLGFLEWVAREEGEAARPRVARPPLGDGPARAALAGAGIGVGQPFVLLAPGATWPSKQWPAQNWRELAAWLGARLPLPLAVLTPPAAPAVGGAVAAGWALARGGLLPALPLPQALQVVGAASLVVAVDGGIAHAAVGMGRPTLALFGPTDPAVWFPYERLGPFRVLATRPPCHPCGRHECGEFVCLPRLSAPTVGEAALSLLAAAGGPA